MLNSHKKTGIDENGNNNKLDEVKTDIQNGDEPPAYLKEINNIKKKNLEVIWRKNNLVLDGDAKNFKGIEPLSSRLMDLEKTTAFFYYI